MRKLRLLNVVCLFVLLLPLLMAPVGAAEVVTPPFRQWGRETLATIKDKLWLPDRKLYADKAKVGEAPKGPAFMWGVGVQLTALSAAAAMEPQTYSAHLREYADAIQVYWQENGGGYDVLPTPKPFDRYYDDNEWIVLALAETYDVTHDAKYRDKAVATFRFVMSGADDKLGGGIYWRESDKASKNTCSNAPAITGALRLYQITGDLQYLATARRLYDWTNAHLQDKDSLFWDNIKLNGKVDGAKFSYNSALMIRANCLFYAFTHKPEYLREAQRIARACEAKWFAQETGALNDTGRFANLLVDSLLALHEQDHDPHWLKIVSDALVFLHDKVRDPNGVYPDGWGKPHPDALQEFEMINQASAARAYWAMARVSESKSPLASN